MKRTILAVSAVFAVLLTIRLLHRPAPAAVPEPLFALTAKGDKGETVSLRVAKSGSVEIHVADTNQPNDDPDDIDDIDDDNDNDNSDDDTDDDDN